MNTTKPLKPVSEIILEALNTYEGDNIWQEVIYDFLTAEEWDEAENVGTGDEFVRQGIEFRYESSVGKWVANA